VVLGFAIVGSVVIEFNNVTRSVLARQPNGVPEAAAAELAKASRHMVAPRTVVIHRALRCVGKRRDFIRTLQGCGNWIGADIDPIGAPR
jgi:hypothetical protein